MLISCCHLSQHMLQHLARIGHHAISAASQVEYSKALHAAEPGGDAALFDQAGLLRHRAVMAHGTCLTDSELRILAERGTAIAHCPLSNFFFGDRLLQVKHALRLGVKVSSATMMRHLSSHLSLEELSLVGCSMQRTLLQLQTVCATLLSWLSSTSPFDQGFGWYAVHELLTDA